MVAAGSRNPNSSSLLSYRETQMVSVLCLCVHNSARSQMAEAYFRKFGGDVFEVESAGLEPGKLNPFVVRALSEEGIDISGKNTQDVFLLFKAGKTYRYVVTVCSQEAADRCPIFPGRSEKLHWPFPDPSTFTGTDDEIMTGVRAVRDAIREKVRGFVADFSGNPTYSVMRDLLRSWVATTVTLSVTLRLDPRRTLRTAPSARISHMCN